MVAVAERSTDAQIEQLNTLIEALVKVVAGAEGQTIAQRDAMQQAAKLAGASISEMPYVVNSAVAEHRINADLRSGKLTLV